MPTIPDLQIGDALTAAAQQQQYRSLRGFGHVSGGALQPAGGTTVEVPSDASVWINGSEVAVSSTGNLAELDPHADFPRWATIVVTTAGEVQAEHGSVARPLTVDGEQITGRNAPRPSPPVVTADDRTIYAFVWVEANASEITSDDIVDRRIDARLDAYNFTSDDYSDADAIAAVEGEDPLDLAGNLNVAGDLSVSGQYTLSYDGGSRSLIMPTINDQFGNTLATEQFGLIQRTTSGTDPMALGLAFGNGLYQFYDELGDLAARIDADGIQAGAGGEVAVDEPGGASSGSAASFTSDSGGNAAVAVTEGDGAGGTVTQWMLSVGDHSVWLHDELNDVRAWTAFSDGTSSNAFRAEGPVQLHGNASDYAAFSADGTEYEIQKDGTDGVGIINFKTA